MMQSLHAHAIQAVIIGFAARPTVAQTQSWTRQPATSLDDCVVASAPDGSGGVFVGGFTFGSLGASNAGGEDAWLAYYDGVGNQTWIRQFGTSAADVLQCAAPDESGGVCVGGYTYGNLGGSSAGDSDAWLARYDAAGNRIWIRQLGTYSSERANAAASDGLGGAFVSGLTRANLAAPNAGYSDTWVAHYDSAGGQTWIHQFGTIGDEWSNSAAPDGSGGVYFGGWSNGSLGGPLNGGGDAWLAHYDAAGSRLWIRQFGTSGGESINAAAQDGVGGVYVGGQTTGNMGGPNGGSFDAWLARYDGAGNQLWLRQLGTSTWDYLSAAAADNTGGVYVSGTTYGSLGGTWAGEHDSWFASYDSAGILLWTRQLGTSAEDFGNAVSSSGGTGVFISGWTGGSLGGPGSGGNDAWLARYDLPCSLAVEYCTSGTSTNGCVPWISGNGIASASAGSGFVIRVSDMESLKTGLIMYGIDNLNWTPLPWSATSTSYLCVKPPTQRTPAQSSGGTFNQCDGVLSIDWNAFVANNPVALGTPFTGGETVYAQGWFRDPPAPKATNLSDGLRFTVCP